MSYRIRISHLCLAVLLAATQGLYAADTPVVNLIQVEVDGSPAQYLAKLKPVMERAMELDPKASWNVSEAVQAGEKTGRIVVAIRYPSMKAMAEKQDIDRDDAELVSGIQALQATGRKVVSRSLLFDRTPDLLSDQPNVSGDGTVTEVTTVQPNGPVQDYIASLVPILKRAKAISDGNAETRIYESGFGGEQSGLVYITARHPSLEAWATARAEFESDPKIQRLISKLDSSARVIAARSLLRAVSLNPVRQAKASSSPSTR